MSHNIIRTVIPPRMKIADKIPQDEKYQPWLPSPPTLLHSAEDLVNDLPMPECWDWDTDRVAKWLMTEINLPQYKDCFSTNFINGRRLIRIDASACSAIGIHYLDHIKKISAGIRKLLNVEAEDPVTRSISLPPRYPLTHYLLFRVPTGPKRENTKRTELFRSMGILDEEEARPFGHWEMLKTDWPDYAIVRFGLVKRKSVYLRVEHNRQPRGHSYLKQSRLRRNYFIKIKTRAI